jgi:hypothetical protein
VTTVPPSSKNLLGCQIHSENTGKYIVNGDSFYTFEKHQVDIQMIFYHPSKYIKQLRFRVSFKSGGHFIGNIVVANENLRCKLYKQFVNLPQKLYTNTTHARVMLI